MPRSTERWKEDDDAFSSARPENSLGLCVRHIYSEANPREEHGLKVAVLHVTRVIT